MRDERTGGFPYGGDWAEVTGGAALHDSRLKGFGGFLSKIRHFARNRTIVQKIEREWLFAFNVDRGLKADVHFGLEVASFGGASARRLLEECRAVGVPFFFKQAGSFYPNEAEFDALGVTVREYPVALLQSKKPKE